MSNLNQKRFYFDWAATAPPNRGIQKTFDNAMFFGNPSSMYAEGRAARSALEQARNRCAAALGAAADEIYFTSGATESNAIILFSTLYRRAEGIEQAVLTSAAEHPSIIQNCAALERIGTPAYYMDIERHGGVSQEALERALFKHTNTTVLALMYVNNETGAVTNLHKLVKTARQKSVKKLHIHSDMTQALGKLPVALRDLDIDSASFSAHKIGGPRGIGILYTRKPVQALYKGGGQERGIRPGTENTAGAFYLAEILDTLTPLLRENYAAAAKKMNALIASLRSTGRCTIIPECRPPEAAEMPMEFPDINFSPYILQAAFKNIPGEVMVRALDDEGFAVSTGSACSGASKKRPVLKSMGLSDELALTSIRISIGWDTELDDINALTEAVRRILKQI
ncbi:MAG: cysteine desulfurase [Spirochaetaceae bacterium]|jgi:cysteine desulfurase|nr:cysteine desulfurase [Spirochaetaceae bacterium]